MADEPLHHGGGMLAVGIHEQHGAAPRMLQPGEQRRLLAEVARQGDHLHVEPVRRQAACDGERGSEIECRRGLADTAFLIRDGDNASHLCRKT